MAKITGRLLTEKAAWSELKALSKADLHAHMIFSAPFQSYQALSKGKVKPPPPFFKGLKGFLDYLGTELVPWISTKETLLLLLRDTLNQMESDGVVYTELSFDIRIAPRLGVDWLELLDLFKLEIAAHPNIEVAPDLGLAREVPRELWTAEAPSLIASGFFKGVDLYGQEDYLPAREFIEYFAWAKDAGLKLKIHTGEISTAQSMLDDLKEAMPQVVQHGIKAADDPKVLEWLLKNEVVLNVCPASNIALGIERDYESHPLAKLLRAGLNVTIGTDDFTVFGAELSAEYRQFSSILDVEELEQIRLNGLAQRDFLRS